MACPGGSVTGSYNATRTESGRAEISASRVLNSSPQHPCRPESPRLRPRRSVSIEQATPLGRQDSRACIGSHSVIPPPGQATAVGRTKRILAAMSPARPAFVRSFPGSRQSCLPPGEAETVRVSLKSRLPPERTMTTRLLSKSWRWTSTAAQETAPEGSTTSLAISARRRIA